MAEKNTDSSADSKIKSLEFLKPFDMDWLLNQLDVCFELFRKNARIVKHLLLVLMSADRNLLKSSGIHCPDKTFGKSKSGRDASNAYNILEALNETTAGLQDITRKFLENIDIHSKKNMDVGALIDEKEMYRQIYVLNEIIFLSGLRHLNIIEIRKFLQESHESLRSFLYDDEDEFCRYGDKALLHLENCIKGYKDLATQCELILEEWIGGHNESVRSAIQKIADQSRTESKILQNLRRAVENSRDGSLQIFSIYEPEDMYDYYLVSPFVQYVNVMLMCARVIGRKSGFLEKVINLFRPKSDELLPHFHKEPVLFSKGYHLAFYFNNKAQHKKEVEIVLQRKGLAINDYNVIEEFKSFVVKIDHFLTKEFNSDIYKQETSKQEQFHLKWSELDELMTDYIEAKKKLQEKLNSCKTMSEQILKVYFEISKRLPETKQKWRINTSKCENTSEDINSINNSDQNEICQKRNVNLSLANKKETCINDAQDDSSKIKFMKMLEYYEKSLKRLLDCLTDCSQNIPKSTVPHSGFENIMYDCPPPNRDEVEWKIMATYEMNKIIDEKVDVSFNDFTSNQDNEQYKIYGEKFIDEMFNINETMTGYEEKDIRENARVDFKESKEYSTEDFDLFEKIQKTEQECRETILKCKSTRKKWLNCNQQQ